MAKFQLGRILFTPGVLELQINVFRYLKRHVQGDWGDVGLEDRQENDFSLENGFRLLSVYSTPDEKIWIITEKDRSAATLLHPSKH